MANDDAHRLLLESLASSGSGLNGNAGLQGLLSQWNNPDQITNLLVQYLAKNQAEAQIDDPSSEEEDFDLLPDSNELEKLDFQEEKRERARRWREQSRQMRSELLALRERNDLLAEALGACYLCWGEYPDCQECQGRGMSGSRPPNRVLFKQFVSPAMSRLRTRNGVRNNDPGQRKPEPGNEMS